MEVKIHLYVCNLENYICEYCIYDEDVFLVLGLDFFVGFLNVRFEMAKICHEF